MDFKKYPSNRSKGHSIRENIHIVQKNDCRFEKKRIGDSKRVHGVKKVIHRFKKYNFFENIYVHVSPKRRK